ncbi:MAG: putative acid CoA ligase [Herminiimonas sp.]|nr:putative acid CoA ligase [Herminiimonas sp.]
MATWTNLGKLTPTNVSPDKVALIDCLDIEQPNIYTQGQIDSLADACARGLLQRGLGRGDAVALLSANRAEFLVAYLGAMRAGLVAVPVNHKLAPETIEFILSDCGAKFAFVDAQRASLVPGGLASVEMDGPSWNEFLAPGKFDSVVPAPDECAMILYTSGSTGRPKGVQLSHAGQLWALEARYRARPSFDDERIIVAAPLFHMNALASCKFALSAGASLVLLPQFEAKTFLRAIGKFKVTWITSVPTMMAMVLREADELSKTDTFGVHYVRMASAPATSHLYEAVQAAFPNAALAGGYGTTEAGPIVFGPTGGRQLPLDGGLGWPLADVEARLLDADGREVDEGELWLRTPANMLGYLNMPDKTREVLTPDGWYRTGDVFRRDAQGCYYFVGRADDMFNCGGENMYPGEVEHIIERMPEVMQACVVPVADELKGQKPVAFLVLRAGARLTEAQVKDFVLANAPAYQHPRRVFFCDALPLAATNKIDRRALQRRAEESMQSVSIS